MDEPNIKKRVLAKVRRHFIHKRPSEDGDTGNEVSLVVTPEQINQGTTRLLHSTLGLIETNRKIYVGTQFLNSQFKITTIRVEHNSSGSKTVKVDLQKNDVDILPLEYCIKRLESYGDLELATWAGRLRTYQENHSQVMAKHFEAIDSGNTVISAAMEVRKREAMLACRAIEKKRAYSKLVLYGTRNSIVPFSVTLNEGMMMEIGHDVESFVEWINENGIPGIFEKDCYMSLEMSKYHLITTDVQQFGVEEGPEYAANLVDKENKKKAVRVKMFCVKDPVPDGFFLNVYLVKNDSEPDTQNSVAEKVNGSISDGEYKKWKCVKENIGNNEDIANDKLEKQR